VRQRKGREESPPSLLCFQPLIFGKNFKFLLANNPAKHYFSWQNIFVFFNRFPSFQDIFACSAPQIIPLLGKTLLFISVLRHFPVPLVLPSCTGIEPTAQHYRWCSVGKYVAAHGYRQKRENKLEIKKWEMTEEGENSNELPLHLWFNLFILIGLN
jgi:hypothetical protein